METQAFIDIRSFQWLYLPTSVDLNRVDNYRFLESKHLLMKSQRPRVEALQVSLPRLG